MNSIRDLALAINRIESALHIPPITAHEIDHYLRFHYGDSFVHDLKGGSLHVPSVIPYESPQPNDDISSVSRIMTYKDLVGN